MSAPLSRRTCLAGLAGCALGACGGHQTGLEQPHIPPPAPPPPRDADQLARRVVHAKLGALVHMDRVRPHPLAPRLASMDPWGPLFAAAGIDPLKDVTRAFVAAATAQSKKAIIVVAEHTLSAPRLRQAMLAMVKQSGPSGKVLRDYPVAAARVVVRERTSVVLAVTSKLLVITAEKYARAALSLMGSGGLPVPRADEAASGEAISPATSLSARGVPPLPRSLKHGWATVVLRRSGDALVSLRALSTSAEQAQLDADELSHIADAQTTVHIGPLTMQVAESIAFRAEGTMVEGERLVTLGELQLLMGFLASNVE